MNSTLRSFASFAALAIVALFSTGCAGTKFKSPFDPKTTAAPDFSSRESVAAIMAERASPHPKLWVSADLVIAQESRRGKDSITATLISRAPDLIRLRGSRAAIGPLFEVFLTPDHAAVFFNREDVKFVGTPNELRAALGTAGDLQPADLLNAVLVQQELRARLDSGAPVAMLPQEGHVLAAARDADGFERFWNLRDADGLVDEFLLRAPDHSTALRVKFVEYRLVDVHGRREPLPWRFEIVVPAAGTTVRAEVDEYKIDPKFTPKTLQEPEAERVLPMSELNLEPQ